MGVQTPAFSLLRLLEEAASCLSAKGAPSHCTRELSAPTQLCRKTAASSDGCDWRDTCSLQPEEPREQRGRGRRSPDLSHQSALGGGTWGAGWIGLDVGIFQAPLGIWGSKGENPAVSLAEAGEARGYPPPAPYKSPRPGPAPCSGAPPASPPPAAPAPACLPLLLFPLRAAQLWESLPGSSRADFVARFLVLV